MLSCKSGRPHEEFSLPDAETGGLPAADPALLFQRYACFTCHSLQGQTMYGPHLNGIYNTTVKVLRGEKMVEVLVDREYFRTSILKPGYELTEGYENRLMPVPQIPERDLEILIDYIVGAK